ncbi:hypothetical protein BP422_03670 [Brevibacillus formosus]|uniref:Uncharacterized protein n=1 Tax=Brevibacillus formosus TaxID=54913 RepID=A0A220MCH3_9BACL|nr:hypothetical protein [Brevibacillus formosus]ASJ52731.1 hypothetical protein BP422_03670 [Brevibacillus formosus]
MKAYRVYYDTAGRSANMIVLADDESKLEEAVANKDKKFKQGDTRSKITLSEEIPLSNVLIAQLSVTELMQLFKPI